MDDLVGKSLECRVSSICKAMKKIGETLRDTRRNFGLTQIQVAQQLNVERASISEIEKGGTDVHISVIKRYVEAFFGKMQINTIFNAESQIAPPISAKEKSPICRDVVLSIKPEYSKQIMDGKKTVEIRRRFPASAPKGTLAYIYSTSPERAMVGTAKIAAVQELSVKDIWSEYSDVACIKRADFNKYFEGLNHGFALKFTNPERFHTPMSLTELRERFSFEPPQSFLYAKHNFKQEISGDEQPIIYD